MSRRILPTLSPAASRPRLVAGLAAGFVTLSLVATPLVRAETPNPVGPRVLVVASGGTGDCTAAQPCGSVNDAFKRAGAGDEIELREGTYARQQIENRVAATTFDRNVTIRPAAGADAVVGGFDVASDHVTIKGLRLKGNILAVKRYAVGYLRVENNRFEG